MSPEELVYLGILGASILVGFLFRFLSPPVKQGAALLLGLSITIATCNVHTLHSLVTVIGTWIIVRTNWRHAPALSLAWTFLYLLFFRLVTWFNLPPPTPYANAVQLLLTLKMVSLANEINSFHTEKKKDVSSFSKSSVVGGLSQEPSLYDILSYSYCYVGIMTGEYTEFICTVYLSLHRCITDCSPTTPNDFVFHIYICIFPDPSAEEKYDFKTIQNIDCYNTDFCVKVRHGMRYWNMTVQWWLHHYIYPNAPFKSYTLRAGWTMFISAYWHGLHAGYYLSFLTIPLCIAAESAMEASVRSKLGPRGQSVFDWIHWFLKMRAYDYMCMGFVLLKAQDTVNYWMSIYFIMHIIAVMCIIVGKLLKSGKRELKRQEQVSVTDPVEKTDEKKTE
ncbi:lysophospholipid acyltransferase 7 [Boleophthalmus pectinirostris]|uniref:lysophospholipid acyltransferase 7 n=1 Tax=Boleophthalmus pectinirostris TaxID=150288 RepID=UPI0024303E44|nr:lysophospholipid acyltransferase 7 [Boleophthalmus pectinirostris]